MTQHAAIYVRVSSKKQDQKSQEPDLKKWARAQDGEVTWYRDTFTGKTMERPGWLKLEAEIAAGQVDQLVVWRIDRLGRTAKGLTALFDTLIRRKVNLVSLKDGIDLATPAGRLMANVLASVAAYETEVRAERTIAGQAVARAAGKTWGGGIKGKRRIPQDKIDAVLSLHRQRVRPTRIARATGLSRPTVYSIIQEATRPAN